MIVSRSAVRLLLASMMAATVAMPLVAQTPESQRPVADHAMSQEAKKVDIILPHISDSDEMVSDEGRLSGRKVGESVWPTWSSMVSPGGKAQWFPHSFVASCPDAGSPASVASR